MTSFTIWSWKVPSQRKLWLVGAVRVTDRGSEIPFYGIWWVFLQLAADPSGERSKWGYWLVDPRWSHVNVSLTLTNQLFKNIKQVILFIFQEDKHKTTRYKHHCTQLQPVLDVITQKVQVKATGEWFAWKIWRQFLYWAPLSWPSVYIRSKELVCFCRNKKNGHSSAVKKATAQSNVQSNSKTFTNIAIAFFLQTSNI